MEIFTRTLQFSIKLNNLLFPLDYLSFFRGALELGYERVIAGQITPNGMTIKEGDLIRKGDVVFGINDQSMFLIFKGIKGIEIVKVLQELDPLLSKSDVDLRKDVRHYQIDIDFNVKTEKDAIQEMEKFLGENKLLEQFNAILGSKSNLTSIVLMPPNANFDSEEYYLVRIEPLFVTLGKTYLFAIVVRSKNREKLEKLMMESESTTQSIIEYIEKP